MSPQQEFKTAKQLNTLFAKRLKASLERKAKKKYEKQKKAKAKAAKKAKKEGKPAPHVDPNEMPTGVLAKDSEYAQRGHDYIKANHTGSGGDARGSVYDQIPNRPHLKTIAKLAARAVFPETQNDPRKPPRNFNPAHGQGYPYQWEAHHMLPGSAFYYKGPEGPCFTAPQREIILRSKYNVNDGHNIMMLPAENWAVPVHELLQHPSDHVRYTQRVMRDLNAISKELQKKIEQKQPHDALTEDVYKMLRNKENDYWELLVRLGQGAVKAVLERTDFVDPDAGYVDIGREYKWGRLY